MITNIQGAKPPSTACKLIATAIAPLLVLGAHSARALECGDAVGPGGHVVLYSDIGACPKPGADPDPALIIIGPITVNLNGFTVLCGAAITGIQIEGHNARVRNGVVQNCEDGVVVDGDGHHKLTKLTVRSTLGTEAGNRGFRVRSDHNHLTYNVADHFNGEGFRIESAKNLVIKNRARKNNDHGFRIDGDEADRNRLFNNYSKGNAGEGFRVEGHGNLLFNNISVQNDDEGFRIRSSGQDSKLVHNRAQQNGATDNEAGIRIQGDGNTLLSNSFIDNFGQGILVTEGSENNTIVHNVALDNNGTDLVDQNRDCDDNVWSRNRFHSKLPQDCID